MFQFGIVFHSSIVYVQCVIYCVAKNPHQQKCTYQLQTCFFPTVFSILLMHFNKEINLLDFKVDFYKTFLFILMMKRVLGLFYFFAVFPCMWNSLKPRFSACWYTHEVKRKLLFNKKKKFFPFPWENPFPSILFPYFY